MAITSSALRQLSDGNPVGNVFGQSSSDPIGFYGVTSAVTRLAIVGTNTALMTTQAQSGVGSTFGFSTAAQLNMVVSTMTALFNMGLIG